MGSPGGPAGGTVRLDAAQRDELRAHLDTVTASAAFASSARRAQLLRYLVERTLAGEGERINEYAIGVDVFEKPASFDPRIESIVRTEVGRLRQKLKEYYSSEGQADRMIIELPLRSYSPAIGLREPDAGPVEAPPPKRDAVPVKPRREWRFALIALIIAAALAGAFAIGRFKHPAKGPINSIVVLPFENFSPNHENEYLADGLTEELTNDLAQLKDLRVVARTSAFQFKGKGVDIREIGSKLNVDAALEGSLAKQGDKIRITAQLNRTSDGYHLWSKAYDARPQDMVTVQQEIARSVATGAGKLGSNVPDRVGSGSTSNPEALDLYLQGCYQYSRLTPESIKKSIALFQAAVEKDPTYARAFLGIAGSEYDLSSLTAQSPLEGAERARAALGKALELDPHSPDAHGSLALIAWNYDWDWWSAEREFQLALEQGARTGVRATYGFFLATAGRFSEAHTQCRIAEGFDPLGMGPRACQFWAYYFERNYPEAKKTLHGMLDLSPDAMPAHALLGLIAANQKDCAQFGWVARKFPMPVGRIGLAYASACGGDQESARRYLKEAAATTKPVYTSPYQLAIGYAFLHEKDTAISYLQKSAADREGQIHYLKYAPEFDEI